MSSRGFSERRRGRRRLRTALRVAVVLGLSGSVLVGNVPAGVAAQFVSPEGYVWWETYLPSRDGTKLHAYIWHPHQLALGEKTPVALKMSPYINSGGGSVANASLGGGAGGPNPTAMPPYGGPHWTEILDRGFTVVLVEPRGFGASGGCTDFGGPLDRGDAYGSVVWAATQDWSTGRVGVFGTSYDGGQAGMALAENPPGLAAASVGWPRVPYHTVQENGVEHNKPNEFQPVQGALLFPSLNAPQEHQETAIASLTASPTCYVEPPIAAFQQKYESDPYWAERDWPRLAAGSNVPVISPGGLQDEPLTGHMHFLNGMTGSGPRRIWLTQSGHGPPKMPEDARNAFFKEQIAWFERYVAERPVATRSGFVVHASDGTYREEPSWPRSDHLRVETIPLVPGQYRDTTALMFDETLERDSGQLVDPRPVDPRDLPVDPREVAGEHYWAAVTEPFANEAHLSLTGQTSRVRVKVDLEPGVLAANLIASVYDIAPDGVGRYLTRGAYLVGADGWVTVELWYQDWVVQPGHRLGVMLSGSYAGHPDYNLDPVWLGTSHELVTIEQGVVELQFLRFDAPACFPLSQRTNTQNRRIKPSPEALAAGSVPVDPSRPYEGVAECWRQPTELTLGSVPEWGQITDAVPVSAALISGGLPLAGRRVTFQLGAAGVEAVTGADGVAVATITLTAPAGLTELIATFSGEQSSSDPSVNAGYAGSRDVAPFDVARESTVLTYEGETRAKGEMVHAIARLMEDDGPPIAGATVTFEIKGRPTTVLTNSEGVATATLAAPEHGRSQEVVVNYSGDDSFAAASTTATVSWGGADVFSLL